MCTAITLKTDNFYVGRNLDFDINYGQKVVITPRNFPFQFRHYESVDHHPAIIGMGITVNDYPLYFDAMNEDGLAIAGLNFVGNAVYHPFIEGRTNAAQFELIPFILSVCHNMNDVRRLTETLNITNEPFSPQYPLSQLHWIVADKNECIVIEAMKDGLHIHDNPIGVLTNNPPFETQMFMLNNYMHLSAKDPVNTFTTDTELKCYSRGMGGLGLPGDLSSSSRFVKCAFTRSHSRCQPDNHSSVSQFFHILHSVEQQDGCCEIKEGFYEITQYSDCMNTDTGILYYTTYNNARINAVNIHNCPLDTAQLITFALNNNEDIAFQN